MVCWVTKWLKVKGYSKEEVELFEKLLSCTAKEMGKEHHSPHVSSVRSIWQSSKNRP